MEARRNFLLIILILRNMMILEKVLKSKKTQKVRSNLKKILVEVIKKIIFIQ